MAVASGQPWIATTVPWGQPALLPHFAHQETAAGGQEVAQGCEQAEVAPALPPTP